MNEVVLYSKPECHLCDSVKEVIDNVRRQRHFDLRIVDILKDPGAFAKYELEIPVVLLNGAEIARYRLDEQQFLNALNGANEMNRANE